MKDSEFTKTVAANLRRLAYDTGKTQDELAAETGFKQSTIACWLKGIRTPKIENIDILAKYFGVTRNEIMMKPEELEDLKRKKAEGIVRAEDIKPLPSMSVFESNLINAYRNAAEGRKEAVRVLLGLQEA